MKIDERECCGECGEYSRDCECDPLKDLFHEVVAVLEQLDRLAEVWGDEGVFRRCRDRLRKGVEKAKGRVE